MDTTATIQPLRQYIEIFGTHVKRRKKTHELLPLDFEEFYAEMDKILTNCQKFLFHLINHKTEYEIDGIILIVRSTNGDFIYSYHSPGEIRSFNGKIRINKTVITKITIK